MPNLLTLFKSPRFILIAGGILTLSLLGAHHWYVIKQRDALKIDLKQAEANVVMLQSAIALEAKAAREAVAAQRAAQDALNRLQQDRSNDPESQEWASEQLPGGEVNRLCAALQMDGCQND